MILTTSSPFAPTTDSGFAEPAPVVMNRLPNITTNEVESDIAVLPVGSFEQHGPHLPLVTDTIITTAITEAITEAHHLWTLPPLCLSCSKEHASFPGTVSISAPTLYAVITDLAADVERQGARLVVVNATAATAC